ncbi:hypothetical protein, partial [Cetobacterium sp.]
MQLEEAGLVAANSFPGKRGNQKICAITKNSLNIDFKDIFEQISSEKLSIPVGSFNKYSVEPCCGVANKDKIIGLPDNPKYFSSPERYEAGIVWFREGWVEYNIPSYLFSKKNIKELKISLELCSEFPFYKNDFISDIYFHLNNNLIGIYESPGDFGDRKGTLTPEWWNMGTEYGLLVTISINHLGTYINKNKVSNTNLETLKENFKDDLNFRISSPKDSKNPGGINIFGKTFGDYEQDIIVEVIYE